VGTVGMVDRLLRLPLIFYMERAAGDLSQRISYNTVVAQVLAGQMASAAISMLAVAGYAALLFYYNWIIAIVVLVLTAINVVVLRLVQRQRTDSENRILRRQNELRGLTTASIRDIETLKSTGREDETFVSLEGQQAEYISATAALVPTSALLAALPTAIMALVSASILILGGIFTIQGTFTIGALLAVQSLASSLSSPIQTLMGTGSQIQTVTSSLNAIDDVLTNKESVRFSRPTLEPGEKVPEISGHLRLDRVSFGYGDKAPLVLQDFSLEVKPGHRIALVGTSGAGKTTIGNIAAGLLTPRSGSVFYDEKTIDQYPIGVLENYISKVDQNIVLFEGTVRQNVTLWDDSIQEDQIVSALEDAQILDDVLARPGSIDARVEEDGRNFSGGQAQRIEIARSLVRNPRLLIMDEATSALDDITEKLVDNAVRRRGVAALIIAHRLSTIRDSDEIIVLGRGGQVLERGTHDDLMGLNGLYRKMIQEAGEGGNVGS
jgi:ABC-type bacteriocin/lantibiotic exporter with double-glycine peptidase domain